MAASSGSPPQRPREPAWKRLGLKLKYAKESSEPRSHELAKSAVTSETSTADSTNTQTTNDNPSPSKKRKTNGRSAIDSKNPVANEVRASHVHSGSHHQPLSNEGLHAPRIQSEIREPNDEAQSTNDPQSEHQQISQQDVVVEETLQRPRRKSVTFSADTKQDEGSTSAQERSLNQESDQHHLTQSVPTSTSSQKQKGQPNDLIASATPSRKASRKRKGGQSISEKIPEYINYLHLFHTDRSSWKFNKNNQKGILRDLFRVDRIPVEYNEALLSYISGLQGAAARQRVIESATEVLNEIAEKEGDLATVSDMESEEARRNAYTSALQRHLEKYERAKLRRDEYDDIQLEEMQRDAERGKRAEATLRVALEQYLHPVQTPVAPESSQSSTTMREDTTSAATTTPTSKSHSGSKRKKRKARTQASSDDSSSDSDTSESEGDYNPKRGPATVQDALRVQSNSQAKTKSNHSPSRELQNPRKKIFDDKFLDQIFPKKQTYHDTAPKRNMGQYTKPRGFAYTHGTRADESESE